MRIITRSKVALGATGLVLALALQGLTASHAATGGTLGALSTDTTITSSTSGVTISNAFPDGNTLAACFIPGHDRKWRADRWGWKLLRIHPDHHVRERRLQQLADRQPEWRVDCERHHHDEFGRLRYRWPVRFCRRSDGRHADLGGHACGVRRGRHLDLVHQQRHERQPRRLRRVLENSEISTQQCFANIAAGPNGHYYAVTASSYGRRTVPGQGHGFAGLERQSDHRWRLHRAGAGRRRHGYAVGTAAAGTTATVAATAAATATSSTGAPPPPPTFVPTAIGAPPAPPTNTPTITPTPAPTDTPTPVATDGSGASVDANAEAHDEAKTATPKPTATTPPAPAATAKPTATSKPSSCRQRADRASGSDGSADRRWWYVRLQLRRRGEAEWRGADQRCSRQPAGYRWRER